MDRRGFLRLAGLSAGAVAAGGLIEGCSRSTSTEAGGTKTLKINSFGGTFQDAIEKVVVPGFEDKYDASVGVTTAISTAALSQLKAAPEGKPPLDVVYMDLAPIYQAKAAGLLQPMAKDKIPSLKELYPLAVDDEGYWVAELVSMTGIAYNTDKVKQPPTSWKDLWDSRYRGKVAISDVSGTAGYQFIAEAARLNGGSEKDIDPGFAALKRLKPNLASIYTTPDEMSRLLSSGEAWMGPWYGDRLSSLKRQGAPVAFATPKEGAIAILSSMCIPKGTSQLDLAHNYIDFQISAKVNKEFITTIAEGPTNSKVKLDKKFLDDNYVPYGTKAIEKLVSLDNEVIAKSLAGWVTRWQSEIAN
jgi:putative spermidine/putrescine transport system substrate-binding protein